MCVQAEARAVLGRIRDRQRPANGSVGEYFSEVQATPSDIRAQLDQLKASYDIVNQEAAGNADWDTHYAEFLRFYADTRPRTEGALAWFRVGLDTRSNIRDRAQRLEEWKAALRKRGVAVSEPVKQPPPEKPSELAAGLKTAAYVGGALLLLSLVRR